MSRPTPQHRHDRGQRGSGPGDPDGSGGEHLRLNSGKHRICFTIEVADIALPATAAHIHPGAVGEANPPVVDLGAPDGCSHGQA